MFAKKLLPPLFGCALATVQTVTGGDILTRDSTWRWHVTLQKPTVEAKGGGRQPLAVPRGIRTSMRVDCLESAPPPAGWHKPGYDDTRWPRSRLARFHKLAFGRFSNTMVCLRGKFAVTDPNAVTDLRLSLKYMGGLVVYLNGTEVARVHVPKGQRMAYTGYFGAKC